MPEFAVDLDRLATHIKNKMDSENLSLRSAAKEIGFGAATLSRILQGSNNENIPDLVNLNKAVRWINKNLTDFSLSSTPKVSTISDVEVQLRALPGLNQRDIEALVAMVKAGYESAKKLRPKKRS